MTLLSPMWLTLLAPFAALAWWTLRAAPATLPTTSAFLWPSTSIASAKRARRVPPMWTIAALVAIATAIVALATPARRGRGSIVVVVDPSYRTSSAATVLSAIAREHVALTLVVPGQPGAATLADVRPTARSTGDDVAATVARLRRDGRDAIVVTATPIERGEGVRVVTPPRAANASIERIGARSNGSAVDVFVRVARMSDAPTVAALTVRSGDAFVTQPIRWIGEAASVDVFVRLASAGDAIEARVAMDGDAVALDDVARLTRDAALRVTVDGAMPASVERFAVAYASVHPTVGATTDVTLTPDARFIGRAIVVAGGAPIAAGVTRRQSHAILADVDLNAMPATDAAMPAGFTAIAWRGGRPIVATRDVDGRRAAWLAIDADAAARDASFVVLLDQAIAWAAGADGAAWRHVTSDEVPRVGWRAARVDAADVEASPGVYVDADGRSRAVDLPPAAASPTVVDVVDLAGWIASRTGGETRSAAAWPSAIAAGFAVAGASLAIGRPRRPANLDVRRVAT